ncbi:MAG: 5-(carboxyamino)imidazole ribonucleotide synthase, partial [Chloroflexota bacterium]
MRTEHSYPALPGSTLGVVGGGQLGRMLAMEARRMGYRVSVLDPNPDSPAGQFADERIVADYSDVDAARSLAQKAAAVTYEFENVDAAAIAAAEAAGTVRPRSSVLRVTQHRLREKTTVSEAGFPVADFAPVDERSDLD